MAKANKGRGRAKPAKISAKTPAAKAGRVASIASSGSKRRPSPTETKPKKRRNRDPLSVTAREATYLPETSTQGYLYGARAKSESGNAILKMRFSKARVAGRASQQLISEDAMGNITANMDGSLTYTLALARRWSIYFLYEHVPGSPPENKWTGRSGTITSIRHILGIPVGSKDCARKVLSDVCSADTTVVEYSSLRAAVAHAKEAAVAMQVTAVQCRRPHRHRPRPRARQHALAF
jgi:hypothetical protein